MNDSNLLIPLLQNAAMLLAMVVIHAIALRHFARQKNTEAPKTLRPDLFTGVMMGLIGIAILMTPVDYTQAIIFDSRSVLLSLTGLFFGAVPVCIAMLITGAFRYWLGGDSALLGVVLILNSGLIGLLWRQLRKPRLEVIANIELWLFGLVVNVGMLMLMFGLPREIATDVMRDITVPVLLVFPLATVVVGRMLAGFLQADLLASEVREKEQRLRMALSASGQDLFELNVQTGEMLSLSEAENAQRYPKQRFHRNISSLIEDLHPDDGRKIAALFKDVGAGTLTHWNGEFRQRTLDGGWAWFYAAGRLVSCDQQGRPLHMLGTYLDITARKRDEENLRVFRELLDHIDDAIQVVDPANGRLLDVNATGCRELGYTREELLGLTVFDIDKSIDREQFAVELDRLREGGAQSWHGENTRKDGSSFPVEVSLKFVSLGRDYIVAVVRNVAERRKAEEALQLASLVYQNSREAMMVTDIDTRIIDVNPTFTAITGYEKHEVVGKTPALLQSGKQSPEFYKAMWTALNGQGHWAGEIWNKRKNGEVFPEWLEINAVHAPDGKIHSWVAQFSDISEMKDAQHQIWQQANYDGLTGLPNRNMFHDRLEQEIRRAHRGGTQLALLFLDLDHFKEVNDSLGHDMGDMLLQQTAVRLRDSVRESDTIARLGGDEFIIILNDLTETTVVGDIAQKVIDKLAAPFMLTIHPVYVSVSIGITLYPDDGDTAETLLKNSDQAMYTAKKEGRNRYYYFTPAMQEQVNRRAHIISELRQALTSKQFHVVYQPMVQLGTGRIAKAEALIRWQHPVEGLISPDSFIPVAEESGLIVPIGNLVFREAASLAKQLNDLVPGFKISVNKSPAQFDLKDLAWLDFLHAGGFAGNTLVVEITEGLLLDAKPAVQQQLQLLRDAGLQVALDDFGTGYSSLAYLKKFAIAYLKIDQSFIHNLARGNQDHALCDAMITMAHRLSIEVIAEGVETPEQRDLLLESGCDYGQGFLFSRPVSGDELMALLKSQ
jgi:diguanylate cyclase (GGDEF)-like protein/PAS domain S-box-containing protein